MGAGHTIEASGDPHLKLDGQAYQNAQGGDTQDSANAVFLNGSSEVYEQATGPNGTINSVRAGNNLSGIDPNAAVYEDIDGKLTNVGTAGQMGLDHGYNQGQNVQDGQTVSLGNEDVSLSGGTMKINTTGGSGYGDGFGGSYDGGFGGGFGGSQMGNGFAMFGAVGSGNPAEMQQLLMALQQLMQGGQGAMV